MVGDAQDVVDFFKDVETIEQMISKLERIKKREADDFLVCIQALKISIDSAMEDTLEMGGSVDTEGDTDGLSDEDLSELDEGEEEKPPEPEQPAADKG
jgi:hypothetical protein